MPDFALAASGAVVFALTTWASLAFGYQLFQNMWEDDQLVAVPVSTSLDGGSDGPGRIATALG